LHSEECAALAASVSRMDSPGQILEACEALARSKYPDLL
jgi:hypothetical protein